MDEYQHFEKLSTDRDFEGGEWIGEEFFYTKQKKGHQQSKDHQLYGIFADDSDDEGGGRKGKRQKVEEDLSRPVAFVSHGVTGSSTEKPKDVERAEHTSVGLGSSGAAGLGTQSAGLGSSDGGTGGLGFGGMAGGLGFTPAMKAEEEEEPMDIAELPTSFGQRILQGAKERQRENAERDKQKAERERRSSGSTAGTSQPQFEQYTKGIGSKLLGKMGYVAGKGLGKNQQGISAALEAKVRPKNMGMGYKDYSEHKLVDDKKEAEKKEPVQAKAKVVEPRLWKKARAAERVRREYRTADELLAEQSEKPAFASQPILDMRGPQARLVTDMEALNAAEEAAEAERVPMPELQHNLRLLVDLAAVDIQRIDGKLRHAKDTTIILKRDSERLAEDAEEAKYKVQRTEQVLTRVTQAQEAGASASLDELHTLYKELQEDFSEEYVMYSLPAIALTQVMPRMSALMAGASPLTNPHQGLHEALAWRPLLESPEQAKALFADPQTSDPYTALLEATVVPGVASAVTNTWEPRDPEAALAWIDAWQDALPSGVQVTILDTLLFPKIKRAVEAWKPQAESVPLHAWLHPWLPWLGPRLEELYPSIRFRLSTALQQWHPSDASALALLSPWHKVFDAKDWEALMTRSILPKLAWALSEALVINPSDQDLTAWNWVVAWSPVMPVQLMVNLIEAHFFPKWHDVLRAWLMHSPNYMQVEQWYLNWKAQLPREVQGQERITAQLSGGMALIEAALDNRALPQYTMPGSSSAYSAAAAAASTQGAASSRWTSAGLGMQAAAEPTLRQMVELYAEQNNLDFVPKAGRREQGLQVYGFGLVSITLDSTRNAIRAQLRDGLWSTTTLEELVEENRRRAARKPGP